MFVHTLHDRLGESQYTESYKQASAERKEALVPAVWARVVGSHSDGKAADGALNVWAPQPA